VLRLCGCTVISMGRTVIVAVRLRRNLTLLLTWTQYAVVCHRAEVV